ncbi:MAG: YwaF family protein [Acholeplasmatales bacterium]|nr:YwaF family protein [Acholeplasmatales bacterium]
MIFQFKNNLNSRLIKALNLTIFVILVLAYIFSTLYQGNDFDLVSGGSGGNFLNRQLNHFIALIGWGVSASTIVIWFYIFYPHSKTLKNIITYFILPLSLIALVLLPKTIYAYDRSGLVEFNIAILALVIQVSLLFTYSLVVVLKKIIHDRDWAFSKQDIYNFIFSLIGILIANIAFRLPKILFSETDFIYKEDLGFVHRFYIYFAFMAFFLIWFLSRKQTKETKFLILQMMAVSMMVVFVPFRNISSMIASPMDNLPLHLCHTAMFFMPLCYIFKWKKLFYFTLYINVLGTFFAMFIPTEGGTAKYLLDYFRIAFWQNHMGSLIMPLLGVATGVFARPRFKDFLHAIIGFSIYFVFIVIVNSLFTAIKVATIPGYSGSVSFFYVNSDYIADYLGVWAVNIRKFSFIINLGSLRLDFRYYYILLFYLVFTALAFGMYYLFELTFDTFYTLKRSLRFIGHLPKISTIPQRVRWKKSFNKNTKGDQMIKITNFSKKYATSKDYATKDINLTIYPGQVFGILGPNGSGKSTLIKSMVGIQPVSSGSIEICGFDIDKKPIEAKSNMGFVPDNYALYEKLTGREYVNYFADLYLVPADQRASRVNYLLNIFELEQSYDSLIRTYSHGMKQKISIIVALIHKPKVWILDEPLVGLDPNSVYQVKQVMQQYVKDGNIVFFSSHIIDIVEKICDRIAIIKNGQIIDDVFIKDLTLQGINLEEYYINKVGQKIKMSEIFQ